MRGAGRWVQHGQAKTRGGRQNRSFTVQDPRVDDHGVIAAPMRTREET